MSLKYGPLCNIFMCVGSWASVTYLRYTLLMSYKKDETAVHCCDPALSALVTFDVSKHLSRSIRKQSIVCLCIFFFG